MAKDNLAQYAMNKWFWWQSEDEFLSSGSDFAYSQNINIYESPKYIELSKAFTQVTLGTAATWYITKILRLPNNIQSSAYFTSTWQIYIDAGLGPVLAHTLVDADKFILNAICFTSYLLVFTATDIHRITFTGNDFKTYASISEALLSFTGDYTGFGTNESKDLCVYNFKDSILYFSAGNKLFSVGNTLAAVSTSETFRKWSKVVGITFLNSNLKIYINYLNVSSSLYFWNETSSDSINYRNRVFKAATTDGQLDYVVCSDGLYIYNGYTWEKLFNYNFNDFGKSGANYFVPQNLMSIDPYYRYIAYNKNVFKFGKKFTNLPNGFSVSSVEADNITAISDEMTVIGDLYYADDTLKVWKQSTTAYKTEWYIEGIVFYWDIMEKIKKIKKVFNAFDIPTWCSIEVYFSVEWEAYPVTPKYTLAAWTGKRRKEQFENELQNLTNHRIQPKIVLKGNWTVSPKLYEWFMLSEYIINK